MRQKVHVELSPIHMNEAMSNLKEFTAKTHLQEAAMTYIVSQMSTADHHDLIHTFKRFDKNGNGTISKEELLEGYRELYKDRSLADIQLEVDTIWTKIDLDGSGTIDYTEWSVGTINKANVITKQKLKKAFEMFDLDGSGKISALELKTVLGQITLAPIQVGQSLSSTMMMNASSMEDSSLMDDGIWRRMIAEADLDGDGEISLEEFEKLMTTLLYNHNQAYRNNQTNNKGETRK
jgi:calcium-dependent protein kinase